MPPNPDESIERLVERYASLVPGQSSPLWTEQRTHVPAAIEAGDWRWIASLYDRLAVDCPPSMNIVRSDALFALALVRDQSSLDAFVARARTGPAWGRGFDRSGRGWLRKLAALVGFGQDLSALEYLIETYGDARDLRELVVCLVQELVSLGHPVIESAIVRRFWRRQHEAGHALSALPLELTAIEAGARTRPPYAIDLLGNWFWFSNTFSTRTGDTSTLLAANVRLELSLDDSTRARGAGALSDAMSFPNGRYELRAFAIDRASGPLSVRGLPLECIAEDPEPIVEVPRGAKETMHALWALFTVGGAYAEGRSAAYGRLHAWNTLRALVDTGDDAPVSSVEARAERCWFTMFASKSPWFDHVCIDVGFTCTRHDGASMIVFAATDSD